jgi:hypothetical protein
MKFKNDMLILTRTSEDPVSSKENDEDLVYCHKLLSGKKDVQQFIRE